MTETKQKFDLPTIPKSFRSWSDLGNPNATLDLPLPYAKNPHSFYQYLKDHFTTKPDDNLIITYPKCGTTLTLAIIKRLQELKEKGEFNKNNSLIPLGTTIEDPAPWPEMIVNIKTGIKLLCLKDISEELKEVEIANNENHRELQRNINNATELLRQYNGLPAENKSEELRLQTEFNNNHFQKIHRNYEKIQLVNRKTEQLSSVIKKLWRNKEKQ